jgi:glutamate-ammonia-ligase adenylyltransferase
MYDVDMRLRPSGNKGPVAVSLSSFRRYHEKDAWTWERMALTRARVIAGPAALRAKVSEAIATAIAGDAKTVRQDAAAMRIRMLRELPPDGPWDVKPRPGGQIEVEFIAQVLQLLHAAAMPEVLSSTTREALRGLGQAGVLEASDPAMLIKADHTWRTVQGMLRITVGRDAGEVLPEASARPLLRALGAPDLVGLRASLDALAGEVRDAFVRYVGAVEK